VIARLPLVRHPPRRTTRTEREADLRSSRFPRAVRAGIGRRRSGAPGADLVIRRSLPRNFRENENFSAQFAAICCHRQPPGRETRRLPHDHRPYTRPKRIHHDAVRGSCPHRKMVKRGRRMDRSPQRKRRAPARSAEASPIVPRPPSQSPISCTSRLTLHNSPVTPAAIDDRQKPLAKLAVQTWPADGK
jgi:hypothetical protein